MNLACFARRSDTRKKPLAPVLDQGFAVSECGFASRRRVRTTPLLNKSGILFFSSVCLVHPLLSFLITFFLPCWLAIVFFVLGLLHFTFFRDLLSAVRIAEYHIVYKRQSIAAFRCNQSTTRPNTLDTPTQIHFSQPTNSPSTSTSTSTSTSNNNPQWHPPVKTVSNPSAPSATARTPSAVSAPPSAPPAPLAQSPHPAPQTLHHPSHTVPRAPTAIAHSAPTGLRALAEASVNC